MTGRRWSDDDVADICQAVHDGQTQPAIARKYKVTENSIRKLLERARNYSYDGSATKWTDEKIALARQMRNEGQSLGALAVHFGVSYNAIQKVLRRPAGSATPAPRPPSNVPRAGKRQMRHWRGQSPLADPLLAALFKHHRERAPEGLVRRLLPAPLNLPTHLIKLRAAFLARAFARPRVTSPPVLPPREYPSLQSLMEDVLIRRGLAEVAFRADSRAHHIVEARHEFFVIAAQQTLHSIAAIGRFLNMDHSTVMHGITRHCERNNIPPPRGQVRHRSLRSRQAIARAEEAAGAA